MDVEGVDGGEFIAEFLSSILGCGGRVGMKGGSVGTLELDGVATAPRVVDAASRKSMIFATSM